MDIMSKHIAEQYEVAWAISKVALPVAVKKRAGKRAKAEKAKLSAAMGGSVKAKIESQWAGMDRWGGTMTVAGIHEAVASANGLIIGPVQIPVRKV